MVAGSYRIASRQLLAQGREELQRGDTRQASEKGWGAAALMVKDVAERRGWEHRSHASLYTAISRLVNETGDDEIRRLLWMRVVDLLESVSQFEKQTRNPDRHED